MGNGGPGVAVVWLGDTACREIHTRSKVNGGLCRNERSSRSVRPEADQRREGGIGAAAFVVQ